jgi:glycosyltransferase involved in cell wall biosynthesis
MGNLTTAESVQKVESPSAQDGKPSSRLIALLGKLESPADGVEDYCFWLGQALAQSGWRLEAVRLPWPQGWLGALRSLWRQSKDWRGRWVLVQYTAFAWSRHGFTVGLLPVLWILRRRGAKVAVVLHDPGPCSGTRWMDDVRRSVQRPMLRLMYRWADRSIFTIPLSKVTWLTGTETKAAFIPVGANLPEPSRESPRAEKGPGEPKEVAVYCVTGGPHIAKETDTIAYAMRHAAERCGPLRLLVLGRNAQSAETPLRSALAGAPVDLEVHGVLPPEAVERRLRQADVQLFVRLGISTRRGSAIAGIACGLPVVAYAWRETAPPVTNAGVVTVPTGDREALAEALFGVLANDAFRAELRRRSLEAWERHFSWNAIAGNFREVLGL